MSPAQLPKVIFLDAVGTLFGVRGTVGSQYGRVARLFGAVVDDRALDQAFFASFKASPPCEFPGVSADEIPDREYAWWRRIAQETLTATGAIAQLSDFDAFFARLYADFATAMPWFLYPETRKTLIQWRGLGIELGVLSNFDTRLYQVLTALELTDFFTSVTISTEVGAAKPSPHIFEAALHKHRVPPSAAWHIGDSYQEDYLGAKSAGMRALWLRRPEEAG
jgi:putative hydrolase of the HAD superfamily